MWEAFEHAAFAGLDNLTAVIDVNRLGQTRETMHGWDLDVYSRRLRAFGWHVIEVDGHDVGAIDAAYAEAIATTGRPTAIVARTVKGSGVSAVADQNGMHGKPLDDTTRGARRARSEHPSADHGRCAQAGRTRRPHRFTSGTLELPRYEVGSMEATRRAYAEALVALGRARGDSLPSTATSTTRPTPSCSRPPCRSATSRCTSPNSRWPPPRSASRFAAGCPFASTYGAFWSRAFDFIRMAAVSRANIRLAGSHAGVDIGPDGPSQMGLEDIASFRTVWGSTVLYPSDANQAAQLVAAMADRPGVVYMRTTRGKTPVIYSPDEAFPIGGSRVVRSSASDVVTLIGAGITLHEVDHRRRDRLSATALPPGSSTSIRSSPSTRPQSRPRHVRPVGS